ncbi:metallophosphoesterase [Pseudactinotalea terrae]|uniref:metallophosphoesterase n=1 Tax=Pseudactinotalea terrae TaxID=1743262 RepID=UPI0012E10F3A|nr:metallophosphoesterase [Pseudactinotalea terrae]
MAGSAGLTWALVEAQAYTLRELRVPVLAPGSRDLRVLHISDLHLMPSQHRKVAWVRQLAETEPDLVINTGDNLSHPASLPVLMRALGPLLDLPGVFALGSNDYFGPEPRNPARYLLPDARGEGSHQGAPNLPGRELQAAFVARGWSDLANKRAVLEVAGQQLSFVGTADAHMDRDRIPPVRDGDKPGSAVAHLGVTHAPYRRVLDGFRADGADMTFAGHTHGGQLCLPIVGALTTNCDLDTGRAKGLHGWPGARPDEDSSSMWLHVSAGLGTNPYTPVRFFCRPEATLLTLVAR